MIKSTSAKRRLSLSCGVAALSAALALAAPALAQETTVGEVVVTAQKRSENLQEVPLSVASVSGERLQSLFAAGDDILTLSSRVPSLYAESSNGRVAPRFYIRGLGNADFDLAASQPVSIIMDDVVMENVVPRPGSLSTAILPARMSATMLCTLVTEMTAYMLDPVLCRQARAKAMTVFMVRPGTTFLAPMGA